MKLSENPEMRYVCCPPPELNPLYKSTEGSETQEETRKHAVLRFIHPTMVHCATLFLRFRAKISNKHKNYLCTVLVTGASASAQVLLFRGSVPLWQPNREIPPHPRSSFSFDILLFSSRPHEEAGGETGSRFSELHLEYWSCQVA